MKEKNTKKLKMFFERIETRLNWLKIVKNNNRKKKIKLIKRIIKNKK